MVHVPAQLLSQLVSYLTFINFNLAHHYRLTLHQLGILSTLSANGPTGFREIRKLLGVPRSTLTFLFDSLEKRGLVTRQGAPQDRRLRVAVLTPQGARLMEGANELGTATVQGLLKALSQEGSRPQRAVEVLASLPASSERHRGKKKAVRKGPEESLKKHITGKELK